MITVQDCVSKAGLPESLLPGEVKYVPVIGEKEGTSCTVRYDHLDPNVVKIEKLPGLTGKALQPKEMAQYAVWLQSPSKVEFQVQGGAVTGAKGTLLGKKVEGGEDIAEKCSDFFGALVQRAMNKVFEIAMEVAHLTKQILPTIQSMPFANAFAGRTRAFAKAAAKVAAAPVIAMTNMPSFAAPGLGLGGKSMTRAATKTRQTEDEAAI